MSAYWIWYKGDFSIYHSILLHSRREYKGVKYPCVWKSNPVYPRVDFIKNYTSEEESVLTAVSNADGNIMIDNVRYPLNKAITVPAGEHSIKASLIKSDGLPCLFIDSKYISTDSGWLASPGDNIYIKAGTSPEYNNPEITPENFIFSYKTITPVTAQKSNDGYIYDFGQETFAKLSISNVSCENIINVFYGESKEEALDTENTIITDVLCGKDTYLLCARAFRYIFIRCTQNEKPKLSAEYEYLPLKTRGSFSCDDNEINKIWDICKYTFSLNSREFFIDGIKRDRWVWAGDAYQSLLINNYLFFDSEISKRTITALLGKPPYTQHINTINDYTMFLIISVWEYYFNTKDSDFIIFAYPRLKELFHFLTLRLDENGFAVKKDGDWIFIDWADFDKTGPFCPEQILLWKTYLCMYEISCVAGAEDSRCIEKATKLKSDIMRLFYDNENSAFIDSYTSGKNNITKHASVLAILFDFADTELQKTLLNTVLRNPDIPEIVTPYFRFYELMALCKLGDITSMQRNLKEYWGEMIKLGATTVWEQFDPKKNGTEHYEMYGEKYGKSLCHAWGSGPIFLLGRYCLGVYPVKAGFEQYRVCPVPVFSAL